MPGGAIDYETFTGQTLSEAVDLANLFAAEEPVDGDRVAALLHLYAPIDRPVDLDGFAHLAARLREVFVAPGDAARVALLNTLIGSHEPRPFIAEHDGQAPHFHFVPDHGEDVRRVGASLAMALAYAVVDGGGQRLGGCHAPGCPNVFVDRTRNHSQRFCSKTCATRVHVAAHRARH